MCTRLYRKEWIELLCVHFRCEHAETSSNINVKIKWVTFESGAELWPIGLRVRLLLLLMQWTQPLRPASVENWNLDWNDAYQPQSSIVHVSCPLVAQPQDTDSSTTGGREIEVVHAHTSKWDASPLLGLCSCVSVSAVKRPQWALYRNSYEHGPGPVSSMVWQFEHQSMWVLRQ